jgi:hypothetical protein
MNIKASELLKFENDLIINSEIWNGRREIYMQATP